MNPELSAIRVQIKKEIDGHAAMKDPQKSPLSLPSDPRPVRVIPSAHVVIERRLLTITSKVQFAFVVCVTFALSVTIDHFIADWVQMRIPITTYRRIGPANGPQVFAAGSSELQFALSWDRISQTLGQGIENWGVPGSSPTEWEMSQRAETNTNLMIIGLDVCGLNEQLLCDIRANVVPISQTIHDLSHTHANWQFSKRLLSQYPLVYLRMLFPTAGRSNALLVGARRKLRDLIGLPLTRDDANFLVLRNQPILSFEGSTEKLSDWPPDKVLRRLALVRSEIGGTHSFDGPKKLALQRMLSRAQERGRVILVVLPVSEAYAQEFVTPEVARDFERALSDARSSVPEAESVRLDQVPGLNSDEHYIDFVHLNAAGRRIATEAFLTWLSQHPAERLPVSR